MQNQQTEIIQLLNQTGPDPGIKLGLQNIKSFLEAIGNPQNKINNVIHIAGTNGKGSTLAFLEVMMRSLDLKVGKYTSPHLLSVTERFIINNEPIRESDLFEIVAKLSGLKEFANLTFFEKLTAAAFVYFEKEKVDVLLLETGLGGRLDATNTVNNPSLCLITNIGLDHQEYLGESLEQIAKEKAGILKQGVPYLTSASGRALQTIRLKGLEVGAKELILENFNLGNIELGLKGKHQEKNANLALNAFLHFQNSLDKQKRLPLSKCLEIMAEHINWPGRLQEVQIQNSKLILDGAHNPDGAKALKESLDTLYSSKERVYLLGFLKTKDYKAILNELLQKGDTIIICLPDEESKCSSLEEIQAYLQNHYKLKEICTNKNFNQAFNTFLGKLNNSNIGVITGSLYLLGKVFSKIKQIPSD